jgi:hypothetical protein
MFDPVFTQFILGRLARAAKLYEIRKRNGRRLRRQIQRRGFKAINRADDPAKKELVENAARGIPELPNLQMNFQSLLQNRRRPLKFNKQIKPVGSHCEPTVFYA